jgi:hypothetical protein
MRVRGGVRSTEFLERLARAERALEALEQALASGQTSREELEAVIRPFGFARLCGLIVVLGHWLHDAARVRAVREQLRRAQQRREVERQRQRRRARAPEKTAPCPVRGPGCWGTASRRSRSCRPCAVWLAQQPVSLERCQVETCGVLLAEHQRCRCPGPGCAGDECRRCCGILIGAGHLERALSDGRCSACARSNLSRGSTNAIQFAS